MTGSTQTYHPLGHARAQHFAMEYYTEQYFSSAAYEREKAAITSYEDGWDRWDGPIWPWRQTELQSIDQEEHYQGCCCEPAAGITIVQPAEKPHSGRHTPVRMLSASSVATTASLASTTSSSTVSEASSKATTPATTPACEQSSAPLWSSRNASPCPHCGRGAQKVHL